MTAEEPVSLEDILAENWHKFPVLRAEADLALNKLSRELPADFYESLKTALLRIVLSRGKAKLKARLVIDTNIIIRDSFRVANGKPSTTERILSSTFVEVMAPPNIVDEVHETIARDLPYGASLEKALAHAKSLLSRVKLVSPASRAYEAAKQIIGSRVLSSSPSDVCFLGLAIEARADAVLSGDKKAFDKLPEMKRWEMSETVQVVQTFEAGTLTLFVAGVGIDLSSRILQQILALVLSGIQEVVQTVVTLTDLLVRGGVEAVASLPPWAWAVILGAIVSILVLAITNKDFQDTLRETASKAFEQMRTLFGGLLEAIDYLWRWIREILVLLWNLTAPIVVPNLIALVGVACEAITRLLRQAEGNFEDFTSNLRPTGPA